MNNTLWPARITFMRLKSKKKTSILVYNPQGFVDIKTPKLRMANWQLRTLKLNPTL